ncbi:MAG: AAA family ATPase [Acidimicrobiales bacterium]
MDKPADVFDREAEWAALSRFAGDPVDHALLGIVSGRRRQGKSYLLDGLCRASGGLYLASIEATRTESLRWLGVQLGSRLGLSAPLSLGSWSDAINAVLSLSRDHPTPVVLDEFPYLVKTSPELPSVIQAAVGPRQGRAGPSRVRLVLCGSSLSFMGSLLSGNAPLRGRASLELNVPTFDFRQAARFWGISDLRLAVLTHSIVGGTPAYRREYARDDVPKARADLDDWVVRTVLNPASPLFREARYLLAEEPELRGRALYHSVLAAIAEGNHTRGGIATYIGRSATDISHHLTVLEDAGYLTRQPDVFRSGRSTYHICEPLVAFYHAIMRPEWGQLERPGNAERVWQLAQHRFAASVIGPHFEGLCRSWAARFASAQTFGGQVTRVGPGVVHDPVARQGHQVDVAVFADPGDGGAPRLTSIGEVKWAEQMGVGHLDVLRHARDLLVRRGEHGASTIRLACYSAAGFTRALREASRREEVVLVGLDRLYHGS